MLDRLVRIDFRIAHEMELALQELRVCVQITARRSIAQGGHLPCGHDLRFEHAGHRTSDIVLQCKEVCVWPVVTLGPLRAAIGNVDELGAHAHDVPRTAHAAFERFATPSALPIVWLSSLRSRKRNEEVRPVTFNPGNFDSAVMRSSDRPSEKYSCSLSALGFREWQHRDRVRQQF